MSGVFCDTSALFALLDRDSAQHAEASIQWRKLVTSDAPLATTNYVVVEMAAQLQRRVALDIVRRFQTDVVPILEIVWIDQPAHARAMEAMLTANRRQLSLVDCALFDTMRQLGIRAAFEFDQHFVEQGLSVIGRPDLRSYAPAWAGVARPGRKVFRGADSNSPHDPRTWRNKRHRGFARRLSR